MIIARSAQSAARKAQLEDKGCVVTIGNFDGIHLGHQHMLKTALSEARARNIPLVVMSFDPQPADYFSPAMAPARLNNIAERVIALRDFGADIACILPFNATLARMPHKNFVTQILETTLNAKCVVIGDDFHYGKGRAGNAQTLREASIRHDFTLIQISSVMKEACRVSSTKIRNLLEAGKMESAAHYLGRRFSIAGRVSHGDARGRTWGFPTLNLVMRHRRALKGVFAVSVEGLDGKTYQGVANLGKRPTVGGLKTLLEVHLFGYQSDAYGQRVCVAFHKQLRREHKFESFDALKAQIQLDIMQARNYFEESIG